MEYHEKKDNIKAGTVTTVVMLLLFIFFYFTGLTYTYPPPPAKKVILIEMTMDESGGGGGGGGGGSRNSGSITEWQSNESGVSSENIVVQHDISLPSLPSSSKNNKPSQETTTVVAPPQPDAGSMYRPRGDGSGGGSGTGSGTGVGSGFGSGTGSGTGSGSGSGFGSGTGSGIGPGSGSGTGGGIGHGTGKRDYVHMPDLTTSEVGKVYVRVHVAADGTVIDAQVISTSNYPTSITNSKIQEECKRKAKTAKYKPGKEEFRIILFSL